MSTGPVPGLHAAEFSVEVRRTFACRYWQYVPEGAPPGEGWPLMLCLHGAGERGDDLAKARTHGPASLVARGQSFPFIIINPLCPADTWWSTDLLLTLLDHVEATLPADRRRIYCTGLSMGGYATWALAYEAPHRFAAIAPICGGGVVRPGIARLKHLPIWAFHGEKDDVIPVGESIRMVEAVNAAGGSAKLTLYPEAAHNSWTQTYDNPALYEWLLSHPRRDDHA